MQIIDRIVSGVGRRVDESTPMVDAWLTDGSRLNIIIPPLAIDGPSLSIRRFRKQANTVQRISENRTSDSIQPYEHRGTHGIAVALLTEDPGQRATLELQVEATHVARIVFSNLGLPMGATDSVLRQIQDQRAEVVIADLPADNPARQSSLATIRPVRDAQRDFGEQKAHNCVKCCLR